MITKITDTTRVLTITLDGDAITKGRVSFTTLAAKLNAAQATVYNLGLALGGGQVGSRGTWPRKVRSACELTFVAPESSSFVVISELADASVLPEMSDLGRDVLKALPRVVRAVNEHDTKTLIDIMPDTAARGRTLKSLQTLCPREDEGLIVKLGNGTGDSFAHLTSITRRTITSLFLSDAETDIGEVQNIVGDLVEIRVKAGRPHIAIMNQQREIECLYPTEMEELISQLVAGSLVEVTGRVQLTPEGLIKQIDEVYDVSTLDLTPFPQRAFTWSTKRYLLREPVLCIPTYQRGLWIYECPRYGLHAFSSDRREALNQFNEEFAFLHDGLIDEPDDALTPDAIVLRDRLRQDIESVEGD